MFRDVTPCGLVYDYQRIGRQCYLHHESIPEPIDNRFLRKFDNYLSQYTTSHLRTQLYIEAVTLRVEILNNFVMTYL
jgi:hypothetical protein